MDLSTLLSLSPSGTQNAVAGVLTPQVQAAMQQGAQVAGDLAPTYDLIATVASGGQPSPMQAISAMAGIATLINPVAGAAIMAMGVMGNAVEEATVQVFDALGLRHDSISGTKWAGGIPVGALPVPFAPTPNGKYDPLWKDWKALLAPVNTSWVGSKITVPQYVATFMQYPGTPGDPKMGWPMMRIASSLAGPKVWRDYHPDVALGGVSDMSVPKNDFEKFFYEVLKKDIEYWWNGQSYINPRDLLKKAVVAWNNSHQPATPKAVKTLFGTVITGDIQYTADEDKSRSIESLILSGLGDVTGNGTRDTLDPIHMGPPIPTNPKPAVAPLVTVAPLIASHAGFQQALRARPPVAKPAPVKPAPVKPPASFPWLYTGGGAAAGAVFGGPPGALIGGIIGWILGK